jgi:protein phosphatase PTC6
MVGVSRELTVVRIPLKSAKHHFGVSVSRGQRPYNEDTYQAGTIEIPAFAKRQPLSLTRNPRADGVATTAQGASGDPQVFYFAVFDGHGGSECSEFLRDELHNYIEQSAKDFELETTLKRKKGEVWQFGQSKLNNNKAEQSRSYSTEAATAERPQAPPPMGRFKPPDSDAGEEAPTGRTNQTSPPDSSTPIIQTDNVSKAEELERAIVRSWKLLVGGYFRRFKPEFFSTAAGGKGHVLDEDYSSMRDATEDRRSGVGIETVLEYSFLKADYDFVSAQVAKPEDDALSDHPINAHDILDKPSRTHKRIGGPKRFKGGSTCSIALISTPTPMPFWHPASPCTLVTSHVGDTRILLCETATGLAVPTTSNHHPSHPREAERMRRYAATFVTDSFGEERVLGLANTRAFGDMSSKRIGVSAEPEITRVEVAPAEYSFLVLVSDGVSGQLSDQEIVDIVKEAKTPEQGSKDVVNFATEVTTEGDNATALVVRLGGWERRNEGGLGSMGTKELRDWRRQEAQDPRSRQR